jgi:hypothetical protein
MTRTALSSRTGDGTKTVDSEFKDALGTVLERSDSIILDTTLPVVTKFTINSNANYTTLVYGTLYIAVTDAAPMQMRFKNEDSPWTDWENYIDGNMTPWVYSVGDGGRLRP